VTTGGGTPSRSDPRGRGLDQATPWRIVAETVTACYPLAIALMFVKHDLLFHQSGIRIVAGQALGGQGTLTLLPQLRFFAGDAIEAFGVVPLALLLAFGWARPRLRVLATTLTIVALVAIVVAAWLSSLILGRLPTLAVAQDYLNALRSDPSLVSASDYLPYPSERRALLLLVTGMVPGMLLLRRWFVRGPGALLVAALGALGASALVAAIVLWSGISERTVYHHGMLRRIVREFVPSRGDELTVLPGRSPEELRRSWLSLSLPDSGSADVAVPAPGRACRSAILVVLETAAARDYSVAELRAAMPRTRPWFDHALIATRHLATHQWSNRGDFSLLSGFYDLAGSMASQEFLRRADAPRRPSSIPWMLRAHGYETRYYYPGTFTIPADRWAVSYLGFEHIFAGSGFVARLAPASRVPLEQRMFDQAEADLRNTVGSPQPFFLVLRTMLGHDPLISPGSLTRVSPADRGGRRLAIRQVLGVIDSLLARVLTAASGRDSADRIALIIIGDHGVRDRQDPDLQGRLFDPVSYHVPALFSCPARFPKSVELAETTSHVDVAPTLAWLLGIPAEAWIHSGLVMVDPRLGRRYTFMLGESFNGVDALIQGDSVLALNRVDGALQRQLLRMGTPDSTSAIPPLRPDRDLQHAALSRLEAIGQVQAATLRYLMSGGPDRPK
jgi:hypothetical protein